MIIVYCEKCGRRISDQERNEGRAVETAENEWLCGNCAAPAPAPAPAAQRQKSGPVQQIRQPGPGQTAPPGKRSTSTHIPRHAPAASANPARQESSKSSVSKLALAGYGIGGLCAIVGLVLLFGGRKPKQNNAPDTAAVAVKDVAAPPSDTVKTAAAAIPAATPATRTTTPPPEQIPPKAAPEAATPAMAMAERARQVDKEMEDLRNQRANRILEEHVAWFKQNPADGWTYKLKLQEFAGSYRSSPAAAEARKLIEELKDVQPPPDRLQAVAPESQDYQLVYDLDLARLGASITYTEDNRASVKQPFDRIAYFLELQKSNGESQYLYVSMDAFTDDLGKIGIPTIESGGRFQQNVANMNVISSVAGITAGTALSGGNIEFWPNNYGPPNAAKVPNATSDKFDFGDQISNPQNGYGSMQVHNHEAKQTLFAVNHWQVGGDADIGIGNNPNGNPDWTFSSSGRAYRSKRLRVLVRSK